MTKELNNLLSLIFQDGRTKIENGSLLVPPEIAKRYGDQIRRFKPEILLALGYCPVCAKKLVVKIELIKPLNREKTGRHSCCPDLEQKHFDKWDF